MVVRKEFSINDYLSLALEDEETVIYVGGEPFIQCKFLLLINPHENKRQELIASIDQAEEMLNKDLEAELEPKELGITSEEELFGHCSNLV